MANDTEITKVRIVIRHLLWQIRDVRKDKDAAWQWVNRFANTLEFQDLETDPDQYALAILAEARSFNDQQRRKGQMLGVRKQLAKEGIDNPTQEQLDDKWLEMYGTNQETTADAHAREDWEFKSDSGDAGNLESDTSATHSTTPCTISADDKGRRTGTAVPELRRAAHSPAPVRSSGPMPANVQKVYDFASLEGLDKDDAYECWYVTTAERDGNDADGNPVTNWKAFVRTWCNTRSKKRSA